VSPRPGRVLNSGARPHAGRAGVGAAVADAAPPFAHPPPTLRPAALPVGTGISTLAVAHTARKEAWDMIAAADYPGWRRETLEHV
jgi:hypothetical protein